MLQRGDVLADLMVDVWPGSQALLKKAADRTVR